MSLETTVEMLPVATVCGETVSVVVSPAATDTAAGSRGLASPPSDVDELRKDNQELETRILFLGQGQAYDGLDGAAVAVEVG